jgi:hypothetical protein
MIAIALVMTTALLVPSAFGRLNDGYRGETSAGGLIAVRVDYDRKDFPKEVHALRWANVPLPCGSIQSATTGDSNMKMKVDGDGAFKGSDETEIGNATVTISGRFKHNPAKASGKFRVNGSQPGCSAGDTGNLTWEMARK